jgi:hypothetical protein
MRASCTFISDRVYDAPPAACLLPVKIIRFEDQQAAFHFGEHRENGTAAPRVGDDLAIEFERVGRLVNPVTAENGR